MKQYGIKVLPDGFFAIAVYGQAEVVNKTTLKMKRALIDTIGKYRSIEIAQLKIEQLKQHEKDLANDKASKKTGRNYVKRRVCKFANSRA